MVSLVPTYSYISIRSLGEREDALNTLWAVNQHVWMISEGSCDTEDWSNDAEISVLHHRNKLNVITYSSKKYFTILVFYGIFDQTNAAYVSIIDRLFNCCIHVVYHFKLNVYFRQCHASQYKIDQRIYRHSIFVFEYPCHLYAFVSGSVFLVQLCSQRTNTKPIAAAVLIPLTAWVCPSVSFI